MSPIGRIFSVLNLILAALFLSWASNNLATSHEYKDLLEAEETARAEEVAELNNQLDGQREEIDNLKTERDDLRGKKESADDAKRRIEQEKNELTRQYDELSATSSKNANSIASFETHIGALESAKDQAVAGQHEAEGQRDEALSSAQDANTLAETTQQENARLNDTIAERDKEITALKAEVSELDTNLATLVDITGVSLSEVLAQKLIKGAVLQANYDVAPGLVALNVGSNDKVKRGYTFEIFSHGQYKGQIRIENVRENMCTGLIIKTYPGQTIQQGDEASTRL